MNDSVRHIAAAATAARVAVARFEKTVAIWELNPPRHVSTFDTVLDFGGRRLALSDGGTVLLAAAYHREGVAAYRTTTGDLLWQRRDIKRPQVLTTSHDSEAYVGMDEKPCLVVALKSGNTIEQLRGVRQVVESPYAPLAFVDRLIPAVVERTTSKQIFPIERATFSFLSIAFGPTHLATSESGGPVRCFELNTGIVQWTFVPPDGTHCLELAYNTDLEAFVGVIWPYEFGGDKQLVSFDWRGRTRVIKNVGTPAVACFCLHNSTLLTSDGRMINISSGDELLISWSF